MAAVDLQGVFPPITTPFQNGKVAYDRLGSNVEKLSKTGIRGFVVLGSNGEYVYLSEAEKREVVKAVAEAAPEDMHIIAGTGCESTMQTIALTNACAKRGAHAALVITPHYYGGRMNDDVIINHFTMVANNSEIPILIYNVPKFTHLNVSADAVHALSRHPNIIGIKDSSGNVNLLGQYINSAAEDFQVMVGTAGVLFGGLTIGCGGGVLALANVAPQHCVEIHHLVKTGQFDDAKKLQLKLLPVNNAVTLNYGIAGLKAAMDMLGYFGGDPRLPMLPASNEERAAIEKILRKAQLLS
jgi:4-hydroxy-2-oxoglutarate aldolase